MTVCALIAVPDGTMLEARVTVARTGREEGVTPDAWHRSQPRRATLVHGSDVAPSSQPRRAMLIHASGVVPPRPTAAVRPGRTLSPNEDSR